MLSKVLRKVLRKNQFKEKHLFRQPNVQQPLQEMAKYVINSRSFFARIFILAESTLFRSLPLLVAAKRCTSVATTKKIAVNKTNRKLETQKKVMPKLRRKIECKN